MEPPAAKKGNDIQIISLCAFDSILHSKEKHTAHPRKGLKHHNKNDRSFRRVNDIPMKDGQNTNINHQQE
jgi:hypothetical protein